MAWTFVNELEGRVTLSFPKLYLSSSMNHKNKLKLHDVQPEIVRNTCLLFCFRHHAEISQFRNGLYAVGSLYQEMIRTPDEFSRLFVHQNVNLKFDTFRSLYQLNFSPDGSNNRRLERDTVYCLEAFLMECDGNVNCTCISTSQKFYNGSPSVNERKTFDEYR